MVIFFSHHLETIPCFLVMLSVSLFMSFLYLGPSFHCYVPNFFPLSFIQSPFRSFIPSVTRHSLHPDPFFRASLPLSGLLNIFCTPFLSFSHFSFFSEALPLVESFFCVPFSCLFPFSSWFCWELFIYYGVCSTLTATNLAVKLTITDTVMKPHQLIFSKLSHLASRFLLKLLRILSIFFHLTIL